MTTPLSPAWWVDLLKLAAAIVILAAAAITLRLAQLADNMRRPRYPRRRHG